MARTVLGRGLGALIPGAKDLDAKLKYVSVQQITPNEKQPRDFKNDQSFRELVQSVKQFGVLQPLIVKEKNGREDYMEGNYEIIAGERRFKAAKEAGIKKLPVVIKETRNEIEGFELALIENIQRQDLNPLEEARAYKYLLQDCKISQEELSKRVGKSRSYIANLVRLLGLEEEVQKLINEGTLGASHARTLVTLTSIKQYPLAKKVVEQGISVRQLEKMVSDGESKKPKEKTIFSEDNTALGKQISNKLEAKVKVKSKDGKGKIEIFFTSPKELDKIKSKILR